MPNEVQDMRPAGTMGSVPDSTIEWLLDPSNPAVAVLTRRTLLGLADGEAAAELWSRRNDYPPVAAILEAQLADGSWAPPARDYQKYRGSLWQLHLLGELHASGDDDRVTSAAEYAFSRQLDDGSWSATNKRPAGSIPCLTANVARALARLGYEGDPRVVEAVRWCVDLYEHTGIIDCRDGADYQLNGYCHMLAPKLLLLLSCVPADLWPDGAGALRNECIAKLRDKRIHHCLPEESREFMERVWSVPADERHGVRDAFLAEHPQLHYKAKPGWLRFGYPLSYNSDVLECLIALRDSGEAVQPEDLDAVEVVRQAADKTMRWTLKNTLNGKMFGDVETKGEPSRWVTLRSLQALAWAESSPPAWRPSRGTAVPACSSPSGRRTPV